MKTRLYERPLLHQVVDLTHLAVREHQSEGVPTLTRARESHDSNNEHSPIVMKHTHTRSRESARDLWLPVEAGSNNRHVGHLADDCEPVGPNRTELEPGWRSRSCCCRCRARCGDNERRVVRECNRDRSVGGRSTDRLQTRGGDLVDGVTGFDVRVSNLHRDW